MKLIIVGLEMSRESLCLRGLDIIRLFLGVRIERSLFIMYVIFCFKIRKEYFFNVLRICFLVACRYKVE